MTGILKGYDQLLNLVLEDVTETMRDTEDHNVLTRHTRKLTSSSSSSSSSDNSALPSQLVCRGTAVMVVSLAQGTQEVSNPFGEQE